MKLLKTFLVPAILLASCGNSHEKQTGTQTTETPGAETSAAIPDDCYKRFSGTIAGQPVVLQLTHRKANDFTATYYYVKQGRTIGLYISKDSSGAKNYSAEEQAGKNDTANAHWKITITSGAIKGTWVSSDEKKTYAIDLKEDFPAGSYKMDTYSAEDSIPLRPGKGMPSADISFFVLLPPTSMNNDDAAFIKTNVLHDLGCDSLHQADIKACIKKSMEEYAISYKDEAGDMYDSTSENASLDFYSAQSYSVIYNDNGWLVLESVNATYEGGAHGMYGSSYLNLDVQNKKRWQLEDIMTIDSNAISKLLEQEARKVFNIGAKESLEGALLVDKIPANNNVFITNTGITFHYVPYEIAAYAFGESDLFIPYNKIMQYLKPAFKQRMKL